MAGSTTPGGGGGDRGDDRGGDRGGGAGGWPVVDVCSVSIAERPFLRLYAN